MLFARLFGLTAVVDSGILFRPSATVDDFSNITDLLMELGQAKGWLRESAWWTLINAVRGLLSSTVEWRDEAIQEVLQKVQEEKLWTQEKLALVLLLQSETSLDLKDCLSPTFRHTPLLASGNLSTLAKILKETDSEDEESGATIQSTGSWKPQLHFVWDMILDSYFSTKSTMSPGQAPFEALFHTVVDESLFANTSSPQRRYWGFQVFQRALPLADIWTMPQLFTPNFMRCWMNNLSSSDRYLHKAAQGTAKVVQEVAKENPNVGFALLSRLIGKGGRPDFDKATKTKTVEAIMGSLDTAGVEEYVMYLLSVIRGSHEQEK